MFQVRDELLARLYPSRRWGERDDAAALGAGIGEGATRRLAKGLAAALEAATFFVEGGDEEYCDFIYVLCLGRQPCLQELRAGLADVADAPDLDHELLLEPREELYLRVCVSTLAPVAAVQQVALALDAEELAPPEGSLGGCILVREAPRAGVYDAPLLARMKKLVALLPMHGLTHLDFGEISEPPASFDPGDYPALYGREPEIANYLFYPQPTTTETVSLAPRSR
jgi:hypothetical protein